MKRPLMIAVMTIQTDVHVLTAAPVKEAGLDGVAVLPEPDDELVIGVVVKLLPVPVGGTVVEESKVKLAQVNRVVLLV